MATKPNKRRRGNPNDELETSSRMDISGLLDSTHGVTSATFAARRLPELKSLWRTVLERSENHESSTEDLLEEGVLRRGRSASDRHLRRRTNSHLPRRKHRPVAVKKSDSSPSSSCRRAMRLPSALRKTRTEYGSTSKSWLPTHLWHAKRFYMGHSLFGAEAGNWSLPLAHANRGNSAAVRYDCTIQDATHTTARPVSIPYDDAEWILPRVCAPPFPVSSDFDAVRDVMLHHAGSYPRRPIGPARLMQRTEEGLVLFFMHPSIRKEVKDTLETLLRREREADSGDDDEDSVDECTVQDGPSRALIRLRGSRATDCMEQALSPIDAVSPTKKPKTNAEWKKAMEEEKPPGFLYSVKLTLPSTLNNEKNTCSSSNASSLTPLTVGCDLLHVTGCGWDLFLPLDNARSVFLALQQVGRAAAIGAAEEAAIALQSDRPWPIFPRDYPDTEQGRRYWSGHEDWKLLRGLWQHPGERRGTALKQLKRKGERSTSNQKNNYVDVPALTTTNTNPWDDLFPNKAEQPVVVRGIHGAAFEQALSEIAPTIRSSSSSNDCVPKKRRRPRRKVRNPTEPVRSSIAPPEAHIARKMLAGLSLPALLHCALRMNDGTPRPGGSIVSSFEDPHPVLLGRVTAGDFAREQGACVGVGFVAASSLLSVLVRTSPQPPVVVVPRSRRVGLAVSVKNPNPDEPLRSATLFLLF